MVRFKNRYIVVRLSTMKDNNVEFQISNRELQLAILSMMKTLHGDFGVGAIRSCFKVHYCNPLTKIIIFKTRHGPHKFLFSVIPFLNKIQDKQVQLATLYTGASVFQCYKFIQNYQKDIVRKLSKKINMTTKENILNLSSILNNKL